jgi:hypothetical protein
MIAKVGLDVDIVGPQTIVDSLIAIAIAIAIVNCHRLHLHLH